MRFIGYRRTPLEPDDIEPVFEGITGLFGSDGYFFSVEKVEWEPFEIFEARRQLEPSSSIGFFKKDTVGVGMDNQQFRHPRMQFPHSIVEIEMMEGAVPKPTTEDWLGLVENLTSTLKLDLAVVLGARETHSDYYRTPFGVAIGLIKVYWITGFGAGYSQMIESLHDKSSFFQRRDFNGGTMKSFVSAPSFEAYRASSEALLRQQRAEIGDELFHRLPVEERGVSEASWVFNPRIVLKFLTFLWKQHMTNWKRFQAPKVPTHYAVKR